MKLLEQGRKFAMTAICLALTTAVMVASYALALAGKLTGEWVQLSQVYLGIIGAVTGAFAAANAYITAKTVAATGEAPPQDTGTTA